jgi:hypothetical protein
MPYPHFMFDHNFKAWCETGNNVRQLHRPSSLINNVGCRRFHFIEDKLTETKVSFLDLVLPSAVKQQNLNLSWPVYRSCIHLRKHTNFVLLPSTSPVSTKRVISTCFLLMGSQSQCLLLCTAQNTVVRERLHYISYLYRWTVAQGNVIMVWYGLIWYGI